MKMSEIDEEIKLQGAKIRSLIDAKQPGKVIAAEVKVLGDLKSQFTAVTGLAWKPGMPSAAVTPVNTESENDVMKKSNPDPAVSSDSSASAVVGPLGNIDRVHLERDCLPTDGTDISDPGPGLGSENGEVNTLVENIVAMFPDTPMDYVKARCGNLVGNPAAIEKFTDELLANTTLLGDGERNYDESVRETAIETVCMDKPSSSGGGRLEGDEALAWAWETEQRHHQFISMFPGLSSDWLLLQVQLTIVQSMEAAGSSKSNLETLFQDKINELVNMNSDVSLVARSDGETPMSIAGFEKDMFKKLDCEPDHEIGSAKIYTMLPKNNMDFSNQLDLLFVAAEGTFLRMMGTRKINCIKYIENEGLRDRFLRCKKRFHDEGIPKDERLVFHGTKTKKSLESIIQNSLQLSCCKTFAKGYGIYFSE